MYVCMYVYVAQVLYAQQLAYHSLASVGKCGTPFAHTMLSTILVAPLTPCLLSFGLPCSVFLL